MLWLVAKCAKPLYTVNLFLPTELSFTVELKIILALERFFLYLPEFSIAFRISANSRY